MAAATANREAEQKDAILQVHRMAASTVIYAGTLVALNTSGLLIPGSDTAGLLFAGVTEDPGRSGASDVVLCRVRKTGSFLFNFSGTATQATVGLPVFIVDDQTVGLAATTSNDVACGIVSEFVSAGSVRVRIDRSVN